MKQKHLLRPSTWLKSLLLMVVMAISGSAYADKVVEFDFNNGDAFGVAKDGVTFSGDWLSYSGLGVYVSGGSSFTVTSNTAIKSIEIDNSSYSWGSYYAGNWTVDGGGTAVASNNNKHLTLTPNTPSTIVKASFTGSGLNICTATVTIEEEVIPEEPIPYKVNISGMPDTGASVTLNGEKTYTANGNYNDYEVAKNLNLSSLNVTTPEGYEVTTYYDATSHTFTVTFSKKEYIEFITSGLSVTGGNPYKSEEQGGVTISGNAFQNTLNLYSGYAPVVVSSTAGNIIKIVFNDGQSGIYANANCGTYSNSNGTWEGSAQSVSFTTSGDYLINKVRVYLEAVEPIEYTVYIVGAPEGTTVMLNGEAIENGGKRTIEKNLTTDDITATETADYYADKSYDEATHTFTVTYKEYLKYAVAVTGTDDANAGVVYHNVTYHVGDNVPAKTELFSTDVTAAEVAGLEGTVTLNDKNFTVTYKKPEYIEFITSELSSSYYNETKSGVTVYGQTFSNKLNAYKSYDNIKVSSTEGNIVKVVFTVDYTYSSNSGNLVVKKGGGVLDTSTNTWTGSGTELEFNSTGDQLISNIKVYLEAVEPIEYTVNIVGAPEGTTVKLDGEAIENGGKRTIEKNLTAEDITYTAPAGYGATTDYDKDTHTFTVTFYAMSTYNFYGNIPFTRGGSASTLSGGKNLAVGDVFTGNDNNTTLTITATNEDSWNNNGDRMRFGTSTAFTLAALNGYKIAKIVFNTDANTLNGLASASGLTYDSNNTQATWAGSAESVDFYFTASSWIRTINVYLEAAEPTEYTFQFEGAPEDATVTIGDKTYDKDATYTAMGTLTSIEVTNEDYNTTATIEEGNVIKVVFSRNAYTFQFEGADNTVIANTTLTIDGTEWDAANTYYTKKTLTPNDIEATHADYNTTVTIEEGNVIKVVFSRNAYTVKFEGDFPEDATITIAEGATTYANDDTYYTKNTITKDDITATYDGYEVEVAVSELVNNQATITVTYLKESTMSKTFTIAEISKSGSKYWTTFCYDRDFTLPEGYTACIVNTAADNGALTIEELKGEKTEGGSDLYAQDATSTYTITPQDGVSGTPHTYTLNGGNTTLMATEGSAYGMYFNTGCEFTCATTTGANITKVKVVYWDMYGDEVPVEFSDINAPTYEFSLLNGYTLYSLQIFYEGSAAQPVIPANEGILISAANYTTEAVEITPVKNATPVEITDNLLVGCTTANAGTWEETGKKYYKFTVNSDGEVGSAGFYWAVDGGVSITAKAGKAYLVLTADQAEKVRGFRLDGTTDGTTDGIDSINGMSDTTPVYNLNGQRMGDKLPAGVYVKGGKKFIVK